MAGEPRSTANGKARYHNRIRLNLGCEIDCLVPTNLRKKNTHGKLRPLATKILQTLAVASFVEKDPETLRDTIAQAVESKAGQQCCQRNNKTVKWAKDRAKKHEDYKPYLGAADSDTAEDRGDGNSDPSNTRQAGDRENAEALEIERGNEDTADSESRRLPDIQKKTVDNVDNSTKTKSRTSADELVGLGSLMEADGAFHRQSSSPHHFPSSPSSLTGLPLAQDTSDEVIVLSGSFSLYCTTVDDSGDEGPPTEEQKMWFRANIRSVDDWSSALMVRAVGRECFCSGAEDINFK